MARATDPWTRRTARAVRMAGLGLAMVALTACAEQIRSHGYVPEEADLAQITVGVDTRDTVAQVLGNPSTAGIVDSSGFYYVRSTFRHFGPTAPKVIEREIVAITFDDNGVVSNIERYGLEDGRAVVLSRRVTEHTDGKNGLLRQLLRNVGQFDTSGFSGR